MSAAQIAKAQTEIARMRLLFGFRRTRSAARGVYIDMSATLRAGLRHDDEMLSLVRTQRTVRPIPSVVLCDISGLMGACAYPAAPHAWRGR